MTNRPPIALVKRGPHLYIANILDKRDSAPDSDLLQVAFTRQGNAYQARLDRFPRCPVGEGDTAELAAQALVERLQADTADFPVFLLALANGAGNEADDPVLDELDVAAWGQQAALLRILAGLAAQTRLAPAIGPDDFSEDDDAIEFYADGEHGVTTVERLTLRIELMSGSSELGGRGETWIDFTLRADGELHDGHSTIAAIARSYPNVAPTLDDWKAGRTVPFAVALMAACKLAGLTEPLPEEG